MTQRVLVDTGPLVAILSASDQHHRRCVEQLQSLAPPLLTCWPVVTEAAWLLRSRPKAIKSLLDGFETGFLELLNMDQQDAAEIAKRLDRYAASGVQLADVCLIHLAQRESIRTLFTLDRRDFQIIRLKGNRPLTLLPE